MFKIILELKGAVSLAAKVGRRHPTREDAFVARGHSPQSVAPYRDRAAWLRSVVKSNQVYFAKILGAIAEYRNDRKHNQRADNNDDMGVSGRIDP
jgi:hypothetical protein